MPDTTSQLAVNNDKRLKIFNLKFQGNQMPLLSENIDEVTMEIRLNNAMNVDLHSI